MMKKALCVLCLTISSLTGFAQEKFFTYRSLAIAHDRSVSAENPNLTIRQSARGHLTFYAGIKYHLNAANSQGVFKNSYDYFFHRFYAEDNTQRLGLKLGLEKAFPLKIEHTELFVFYDFQYCRLMEEQTNYEQIGMDTVNGNFVPIFQRFHNVNGYYNSFEHHVGVGGRIQIIKNLSVKMQGGLGYSLTKGPFNEFHPFLESFGVFSRMFSFGFEYRFEQKAAEQVNRKYR